MMYVLGCARVEGVVWGDGGGGAGEDVSGSTQLPEPGREQTYLYMHAGNG